MNVIIKYIVIVFMISFYCISYNNIYQTFAKNKNE
jgi:hypothetical protein